MQANLHGENSHIKLNVDSALKQKEKNSTLETLITTNLQTELTLKEMYPLNLQGKLTAQFPEKPSQEILLNITDSILTPNLKLVAKGWTKGEFLAQGNIQLKEKQINLSSQWKNIDNQEYEIKIPEGKLILNGPFSDILLTLSTEIFGKDIPKIQIKGEAEISPSELKAADIVFQLLEGELRVKGNADFSNGIEWNGIILAKNIDAAKLNSSLDIALDGKITSHGQIPINRPLSAFFEINNLNGKWNSKPIHGDGKVTIENNKLIVDNLLLNLANNRLSANGMATEENTDLKVDIDAPELGQLLPIIRGKIVGKVYLQGNLKNPNIASDLKWTNLAYLQNDKPIVTSFMGELKTDGLLEKLPISLNTSIKGNDIPPMDIKGDFQLTPEKIQDIKLLVHIMNGDIQLNGDLKYQDYIQWDLNGKLTNIQPQTWRPNLQGNVSGQFTAQGSLENEQLKMYAKLSELSGSWQNKLLNGQAVIEVNGKQISLEGVSLGVGNNQIAVEGNLSDDNLNLQFDIDGAKLSDFYPPLKGSLRGNGKITGTKQYPLITADLQGENFQIEQIKIAKANIKLDSGLEKQANFNNKIDLSGISINDKNWSEILLKTDGKYENHQIALQTRGGEADINLQAKGGFSSMESWSGRLNELQLKTQDLAWQLQQPSAIEISPQKILLDNLCLKDNFSDFCVKVVKQEDTSVNYDIKQIDPRSIEPFLPNTLKLSTRLVGKGEVKIRQTGQIYGDANIALTPGAITFSAPNQPPVTLTIKKAAINTKLSDNNSHSQLDIEFAEAGIVKGDIRVAQFTNAPNINGNIKINMPDIGKFAYLVPQVSELKGTVQGEILIAGPIKQPKVSGEMLLNGGKVIIPEYATELNNIRLRLSANHNGNIDINGNIGTPKGGLTTNGVLQLAPLKLNLILSGEEMLLANSKQIRLLASPDFKINIDPKQGIVIQGSILIPEAKVSIPDTSNAAPISEDVVIVNGQKSKDELEIQTDKSTPLKSDIVIRLGNKVFFDNKDMRIRLIGGLTVLMRPGEQVKGRGRIEVASGIYELYGQELDIKRGWVTFSGNIANPSVDVLATREVGNVEAGAHIIGTVKRLRLDLTSDPLMPDSAILSYLLFGRPPDSGTDSTALLEAAAIVGTKGLFPDDLAEKTGLDVFDLGVGGLKAGKYLMKDLYVGMRSNFFTQVTQFLARYQVTDRLSIEASSSQKDGNAIDAIYQFKKD
ncbi:translocation/assembly module TamB domain-containing protein [Suttonella ornithocola]|uniref:translocation/assembly module TamB domain-containing protein n=1 Tax=Suttonella ornithocola TaxID=279832 RepID=UPI000934D4C7|nr:translocation/assembly module TamB domain-containing protein [Suttonella ornithocola]